MTRLREEEIRRIASGLEACDETLAGITGVSLRRLACLAAGIDEHDFERLAAVCSAAVIPVSSGNGILVGFSEVVRKILVHLGIRAAVTQDKDVGGLAQAYREKNDLIFLADDEKFIVINTIDRTVQDNAHATGAGYAWGLNLMAGGLKDRSVLIMGLGPVGAGAARMVLYLGGRAALCDVDGTVLNRFLKQLNETEIQSVIIEKDPESAIGRYRLLLDATPARNLIRKAHISPETRISAPGIPLGLTYRALSKISSNQLLHDLLEIGVATMTAASLKRLTGIKG